MKREKRLTRPEQYSLVYREGDTQVDRILVLKYKPNHMEITRWGISVNKRIGNAVIRNRVKRILREILRLASLKPGWDIILIARSPAASSKYKELEGATKKLLTRAQILES